MGERRFWFRSDSWWKDAEAVVAAPTPAAYPAIAL